MPLRQPASRSPEFQARLALATSGDAAGAAMEARDAAGEALSAAAVAVSAAETAGGVSEGASGAVGLVTKIQNARDSYSPPDVLTASTAGSASEIAVAAHNHTFIDGTVVALSAATITGLLPETRYHVAYDDPTLAGGAVVYITHLMIDSALASVTHPDRYYVGEANTPATGEAPIPSEPGPGLPYWKRRELEAEV